MLNEKLNKTLSIIFNVLLILLSLFLPLIKVSSKVFIEYGSGLNLLTGIIDTNTEELITNGELLYWTFIFFPLASILFNLQLTSKPMKQFMPIVMLVLEFIVLWTIPFKIDSLFTETYRLTNPQSHVSFGFYILLVFIILEIIYYFICLVKMIKLEKEEN